MSDIRLDKVLASQNVGSRSKVREMIKRGKINVNGEVVKKTDLKVDPSIDEIYINGERLVFREYMYIMMNKPSGVVSASRDPKKKTVVDLVAPNLYRRDLFPAGRLDIDTEGLIIITNDGDFAHRMLSPKKKVYKIYEATVNKKIGIEEIEAFKQGIIFNDGTKCLPAELDIIQTDNFMTKTEVKICEGKFHQIKKMFLSVGAEVVYLKRKQIGGLVLDEKLKSGESRELTEKEIESIFATQYNKNKK